jgi:hypothetical protein
MDDAINSFMSPGVSANNSTEDDEFDRWKRNEPRAKKGTEYANYPIKYWVSLRDQYPSLSQLALDVLSIPASSCECERMFSELSDLLEPRRQAIQPQLLAAIQCVRRWQKSGLGDDEMAAKAALSDADLDALYDMSRWDDDCNTKDS